MLLCNALLEELKKLKNEVRAIFTQSSREKSLEFQKTFMILSFSRVTRIRLKQLEYLRFLTPRFFLISFFFLLW